MSEVHDIFLRAHTIVVGPRKPRRKRAHARRNGGKTPLRWPKWAIVFDCETRIDSKQALTFGFYRVLKLQRDFYILEEEGAFFEDDLPDGERIVLENFVKTADTEVRTFPPDFPCYPRSRFVKSVLYKFARKGALIVGFHICFDLARLARRWPPGEKNEWSLVLVQYPDGSDNLHYPPILIEPIDSKKSFISFRNEWISKKAKTKRTKIANSRFLDLRTLLWAL